MLKEWGKQEFGGHISLEEFLSLVLPYLFEQFDVEVLKPPKVLEKVRWFLYWKGGEPAMMSKPEVLC